MSFIETKHCTTLLSNALRETTCKLLTKTKNNNSGHNLTIKKSTRCK